MKQSISNDNTSLHNLIKIKCVEKDDSQSIWEWRNDQMSIEMSIANKRVGQEEHDIWFKNTLEDLDCYMYIGYLSDNEKIGVSRFNLDRLQKKAEVSINLNPKYRNKKLSTLFLFESIKIFKASIDFDITATIKKNNFNSINCFKKNGFILEYENKYFFYFKYRA